MQTKFMPPTLESVLSILSGSQMAELSDPTTFALFGRGAPSEYEALSTEERIAYVVELVRESAKQGYFTAWKQLSEIAPAVRLYPRMMADTLICVAVYDNIRPATSPPACTTGLRVTITQAPTRDSIFQVGPKSVGGNNWTTSDEYTPDKRRRWSNSAFALTSPCVAFGWLGVQRAPIAREDYDACDALAFLGTIDYDYDRVEARRQGYVDAMELARMCTADLGTPMQGMALATLVSFDLQQYVRRVQEAWVESGKGAANLGPKDITPADWFAAAAADCTTQGGFGYESAAVYGDSRAGMFTSMVVSNCYDVLYDRMTSCLMSSVMYLAAAGVAQYGIHTAFCMRVTDRLYWPLSHSTEGLGFSQMYGDNAALSMTAWSPFNHRYRTWERFVNYTSQLRRSTDSIARDVLTMATKALVLPDWDIEVEDIWIKATTQGVEETLIPRDTVGYKPSPAPEMSDLPQPDLCPACTRGFQSALHACATDELHGIPGLPPAVFAAPAPARAAAIRRAAIFATNPECCDPCASRIGCWADSVAYMVLTALMSTERSTPPSEWLLQSYAVGTVTTWPMSISTVLSGFDLICDAIQEDGAMGHRDVLDCYEYLCNKESSI
ncbi:hypothetical protein C8R44DRAFT_697800 [Mycena epipterygia]|nr:hypothetical protein C8R44DRAFT_697800 [Mycena epipterygia]